MHAPKTLISPKLDTTRTANFDFRFSSFATCSPDMAKRGPLLLLTVVVFDISAATLLLISFSSFATEPDFRFRMPLFEEAMSSFFLKQTKLHNGNSSAWFLSNRSQRLFSLLSAARLLFLPYSESMTKLLIM